MKRFIFWLLESRIVGFFLWLLGLLFTNSRKGDQGISDFKYPSE